MLPTIWANVGQIFCGASPGETTQPPTPTVYEQILDRIGTWTSWRRCPRTTWSTPSMRLQQRWNGRRDIPYKIGPGLKVVNSTLTVDTADAVEEAHTVTASQFLNEAFALRAGLPEEQMGLGHAFEIDPDVENGFLYELAQAEMAREIFPQGPPQIHASHQVYDRQYLPRPGAGRTV